MGIGRRPDQPRRPEPVALDASLATAPPQAQAGFHQLVPDRIAQVQALSLASDARVLARHPIDGKLMVLIDAGPHTPADGSGPVWLAPFYIDAYPTTCARLRPVRRRDRTPPPAAVARR